MDFLKYPIVSSRDANRRFAELKRQTKEQPVIVTNDGKPEVVMLSFADFETMHSDRSRATQDSRQPQAPLNRGRPRTLLDLAMSSAAKDTVGIDFEPVRGDVELREIGLD